MKIMQKEQSYSKDIYMFQILTLNEHGTPHHWSTWQDAVVYKAKGLVVWEMGDYDWTKYGGQNRLSGEQSSITFSSIIAVKGAHHPKRETPSLTNPNLFGRDLHTCAYCGGEFKDHQLTNDHIVPKSRGGKHVWTNCVTACKRCNNRKDDSLLEEVNMELLYVPYIPSREEALILRNRNILADQMDFLRHMLPAHSRLHRLTGLQ
jgi:5-methylcytosine-specific restriction endonuclease McrA